MMIWEKLGLVLVNFTVVNSQHWATVDKSGQFLAFCKRPNLDLFKFYIVIVAMFKVALMVGARKIVKSNNDLLFASIFHFLIIPWHHFLTSRSAYSKYRCVVLCSLTNFWLFGLQRTHHFETHSK